MGSAIWNVKQQAFLEEIILQYGTVTETDPQVKASPVKDLKQKGIAASKIGLQ